MDDATRLAGNWGDQDVCVTRGAQNDDRPLLETSCRPLASGDGFVLPSVQVEGPKPAHGWRRGIDTMKSASAAKVAAQFNDYLEASRQQPVLVTRNGKPVAVLVAVQDRAEAEEVASGRSRSLR